MAGNTAESSPSKDAAFDQQVEDKISANGFSPVVVDPIAERRLVRKLDVRIVPFLFLVYTMSFLDRINIGNARIAGMQEDLKLGIENRYNTVVMVFFIFYIALEVPSNMIMKKARPNIYMAGLMFCWGIVNMCMGFVQSFGGLIACRIILGIFEAGVLPAIIYLTSMYYRRFELQIRMTIMFLSTSVAGAFGGLLAYGITQMDGIGGYRGWRWIFLLEGGFTVLLAIVAPFIIVPWPARAKFLSDDEKKLMHERMSLDVVQYEMDTLNKFSLRIILTDWKVWLSPLIFLGSGLTGLIMPFFLPTILVQFGWKGTTAQLFTVPIYAASFVMGLLCSWLSDRLKNRYGFIMIGIVISSIGYILLLVQDQISLAGKYAAAILVPMGASISLPIIVVWHANNLSGHWKRAIGTAVQISLGNLCGIIGSYIFLDREAPTFSTGFAIGLGLMWLTGICATIQAVGLWYENKKRDRGDRDDRLSWSEEHVRNLGDYHPGFRFTL